MGCAGLSTTAACTTIRAGTTASAETGARPAGLAAVRMQLCRTAPSRSSKAALYPQHVLNSPSHFPARLRNIHTCTAHSQRGGHVRSELHSGGRACSVLVHSCVATACATRTSLCSEVLDIRTHTHSTRCALLLNTTRLHALYTPGRMPYNYMIENDRHRLGFSPSRDTSWACDGAKYERGCLSGITTFGMPVGCPHTMTSARRVRCRQHFLCVVNRVSCCGTYMELATDCRASRRV